MSARTVLRTELLQEYFEELYLKWNHKKFVCPDPLQVVYDYNEPGDQELVAFIAAVMAYGRVDAILKAIDSILVPLGKHPAEVLLNSDIRWLERTYEGFRYRFYSDNKLIRFLSGISGIIKKYGSLELCFNHGLKDKEDNYLSGLDYLQKCIQQNSDGDWSHILSFSDKGGAQKRLNLFLRWVIRKDNVDLGLWSLSPSKLLIPLDTHMHKIGLKYGMTVRKNSSGKCVSDMTSFFKQLCPDDPVKYDFALTREGIRKTNLVDTETGVI
ncbi:TIGR02757 family protein [Spirochaeta cellobiosiphila]|uniref:TIGR02757 family protein n=1 Tax=Spirochaeta cellobiosiphila TaxID=504483 RepID=UPI001469ADD0|nr:TIGR02757 family protein [Spirochaeta cellobiosiphila]